MEWHLHSSNGIGTALERGTDWVEDSSNGIGIAAGSSVLGSWRSSNGNGTFPFDSSIPGPDKKNVLALKRFTSPSDATDTKMQPKGSQKGVKRNSNANKYENTIGFYQLADP